MLPAMTSFDLDRIGGRRALDRLLDEILACGELALRIQRSGASTRRKPDRSPVTEADEAVEKRLLGFIREHHPETGFFGEESGKEAKDAPLRWIVDPIDGTRAFIRHLDTWSILVTLEAEGEPVVGIAFFPSAGDLFVAVRGDGAHGNGRPLHLSEVSSLDEALVCHGGLQQFTAYGFTDLLEPLGEKTFTQRGFADFDGYRQMSARSRRRHGRPRDPGLRRGSRGRPRARGRRSLHGPSGRGDHPLRVRPREQREDPRRAPRAARRAPTRRRGVTRARHLLMLLVGLSACDGQAEADGPRFEVIPVAEHPSPALLMEAGDDQETRALLLDAFAEGGPHRPLVASEGQTVAEVLPGETREHAVAEGRTYVRQGEGLQLEVKLGAGRVGAFAGGLVATGAERGMIQVRVEDHLTLQARFRIRIHGLDLGHRGRTVELTPEYLARPLPKGRYRAWVDVPPRGGRYLVEVVTVDREGATLSRAFASPIAVERPWL